ncbi:Pop3p [Kluyveromyces lactis]|uniref:KLLA0C12199p n=1 Tax=Kluyveromyces lactis (strain ATCC 8585 / CBS 2359 / DSM 70799 / NBRC 1267 / NRRL Y-1140 / WM37) TaxID=284590 RepID=Q6CTJ8_KLULA|nr:uncharacterized protein KLLA0_C12199g [Kluyveromyces lactis]CAH01592.1 KLLA0C12199p [Kluyveromyces lactis]|eukprot:XP_452741.1 uncharacterized protein KLLA0_C12199g [Kluyveromyces lactis]
MNSLQKEEKRVAKRRQVYKPILENPFTNEAKLWPHVTDQKLVLELLEEKVLKRWKLLQDMGNNEESITVGFNEIVDLLSHGKDEYMLFVCNKDLPSVLISQLPILCETSDHTVTLVQLPRLSSAKFDDAFRDVVHDGMCLVRTHAHYQDFAKMISTKVEPLSIPWLHSAQFKKAPVKLLATTAPIIKKQGKQGKQVPS